MSFVSSLASKYEGLIRESVSHPLTDELCKGELPDYKLFVYLNQDLKFFQRGMNVFGKTLAYCDDAKSSITLGKQIGFVSNDENEYFEKCLREIELHAKEKVPKMASSNVVLPKVQEYLDLLDFLTYKSESYLELVTFMYVMEFVYLGWAEYNICLGNVKGDLEYKYNEWIVLHSGPDFSNWVEFLKNEVERVTANATEEELKLCERTFVRALKLEIDFFEECYKYSE
ncbi:protein Pet18p [[Candida] railenensis]|uniref:Protein Pet18p n=1 Tax=[Candida] railenensis TaxID=45579 RepID=A0A9P0QJA4_9ASCO|nr:protein Pet18p [[Candida] railenensis]